MREMTTDKYWDCECETRYIHSKDIKVCDQCFARQEDQPDSIETEVMKINMALDSRDSRP